MWDLSCEILHCHPKSLNPGFKVNTFFQETSLYLFTKRCLSSHSHSESQTHTYISEVCSSILRLEQTLTTQICQGKHALKTGPEC